MKVYLVLQDDGYSQYLPHIGIYRNREDAELARDHLEAIQYDYARDTWLRNKWGGTLDMFFHRWYSGQTYTIEEDEVIE